MALGLVVAASSMTAAEAAPKAYGVTVKVSKTTADVGATIKVTGKVSGENARKLKGKKVTVQRKYGNAGWQKVADAKISSKRTFSLSTKLVAGGNTSFRVVKSKSGKIRTGTSATRTLSVYKWIDLTTAPSVGFSAGLRNHPVTLNGKTYARALQGSGVVVTGFNATGCTALTTTIGFPDKEKVALASTDSQTLTAMSGKASSATPTEHGPYVVTRDEVKKVTINFASAEVMALVNSVDAASGPATAVLADPLVRCNSDSLALVPDDWSVFGPS